MITIGAMVGFLTMHYPCLFFSDDDECLGEHPCHTEGECVNIYGGFFCRCDSGYFGDGVENCTGINVAYLSLKIKINDVHVLTQF